MNFKITDTSAKSFAMLIYSDISSYVDEHQDEYRIFLREEGIELYK